AYSPKTGYVDPFGGMEDLRRKTIRCVGRPEDRFREDALRMLRAFRFSSKLLFGIDPETKAAALSSAGLVRLLAGERVFSEFCELLLGDGVSDVLKKNRDFFVAAFPETSGIPLGTWSALSDALPRMPRDPSLRTAAFLLCAGEEAGRTLLSFFRASRELTERFEGLIRSKDAAVPGYREETLRYLSVYGMRVAEDAWNVQAAFGDRAAEEALGRLKNLPGNAVWRISDLDLRGDDLLAAGFPAGEEIGKTLKELLEAVLSEKVANRKEDLLRYAKELKTDGEPS
ncbi:MAG: hypothetical protein II713_06125, partial [Clostridia bacterium]|nr:hypothetical protein [Clostridia bacterium]